MEGTLYIFATFNQWNDDERNVNVNRNDNDWNDNWWFAGVCYSLLFSPIQGEFCFVSCPFQPPSIFPISSKGPERAMYFLSSIDFVSHNTSNRMRVISAFRMVNCTPC